MSTDKNTSFLTTGLFVFESMSKILFDIFNGSGLA